MKNEIFRKYNIKNDLSNGFLYVVINIIIETIKRLNLIELFKYISRKLLSKESNKKETIVNRFTTDVFIVLKWIFIIILFSNNISSIFITFFIWYLIIMNVFTYFYYHIWKDEVIKLENYSNVQPKRRFVNLILALAFSVLCFAYLYQVPYISELNWGSKQPSVVYSLMFSFSNSLAANYEGVKPETDFANIVCTIQLAITFIFVTIILSRSIPQPKHHN